MRQLAIIAWAAIALLTAIACADPSAGAPPLPDEGSQARSDTGTTSPASPPTPTSGTSSMSQPPPSTGSGIAPGEPYPLPEHRIDASALPEGYPKQVLTDAGRMLLITAMERGCTEAGAEVVGQDAERVTVLMVETEPTGAQACTDDIRYPTVTVQLDRPLGERTVVLRYERRTE